jgi:hypothetical protein
MPKSIKNSYQARLTRFDRNFFTGKEKFTYIGSGSLGGKAQGLGYMKELLETEVAPRFFPDIHVTIPTLTVIATDSFDRFMIQNDLHEIAFSNARDDLIAHAFQRAELPAQLVGDLRALIAQVHTPLAIRSSSMLEDSMFEPFASVYVTKMTPNNQLGTDARFGKMVEAIKYVYASTFFNNAKNYIQATKHTTADEKMAVIIQEVVGCLNNGRFYPHISGVARSYNFYPMGPAQPMNGVVNLALGLGKTIVDEGIAWSYSPAYPQANPPYNSVRDLLKETQKQFWAIHMGEPSEYDPIKEVEYIRKHDLSAAEQDGTLRFIASTYKSDDDKIVIGVGEKGPRIVNFAPILRLDEIHLNDLLKELLKVCEDALGSMVELEFALTLDERHGKPARFGFLQVRPMVVSDAVVDVSLAELTEENVIVASEATLGNGMIDTIRDIIYVKRESFDVRCTQAIGKELERMNYDLASSGTPYLLIGFGRWGSSDPSGGIPVNFGQISGAKVIVEATLPNMNFMLSQGSHFFHNITSFRVFYFSIEHMGKYKIAWEWLDRQNAVSETKFVRHVKLPSPLEIRVDGRQGRGVISHE